MQLMSLFTLYGCTDLHLIILLLCLRPPRAEALSDAFV